MESVGFVCLRLIYMSINAGVDNHMSWMLTHMFASVCKCVYNCMYTCRCMCMPTHVRAGLCA